MSKFTIFQYNYNCIAKQGVLISSNFKHVIIVM